MIMVLAPYSATIDKRGLEGLETPNIFICTHVVIGMFLYGDFQHVLGLILGVSCSSHIIIGMVA